MKLSKEFKAGLMLIGSIAFFIYGYNYLKGYDIFSASDEYYAIYNDANGVMESNPVLINGMRVGKVQKIYFHPDNSGRVIARFIITNTDFKIPKNTVARISNLDLLGAKGVKLIPGNAKEMAVDGDTLLSDVEMGMADQLSKELLPTKTKAENLIVSIDSIMQTIQSVVGKGSQNNLKAIIENLKSTTENVDGLVVEQKKRLSSIMANLESISGGLRKNESKLNHIIQNFDAISDSLAKANLKSTINKADKTMNELSAIMEKINSGKGSLGMLVNNDSLYVNLNSTSKDLDKLFIDLKENPNRYVHFSVFGKKEKKNKKK